MFRREIFTHMVDVGLLTTIELFSGLGGLSQGFIQAGYKTLFATDIESDQIETFARNHLNTPVVVGDIRHLSSQEIMQRAGIKPNQLDVLLGGPPCQGFSTYGQRRSDDDRNKLFREFARVIEDIQPRAFVMENVIGLLSMNGGDTVKEIMETFTCKLNYRTTMMVLDAHNFGVPQYRRRVFFIGHRFGDAPSFPLPTHRTLEKVSRRRTLTSGQTKTLGIQATLFTDEDIDERVLKTQEDYQKYLSMKSDNLLPALTVRDAISDLPGEALSPQQIDEDMPYPDVERSSYQILMKGDANAISNHAAKRHMLRRMIRTALIDQGDYGAEVKSRLHERGVPQSIIEHVMSGTFTEDELRTIRDTDKVIERQLLDRLKVGDVTTEDLSNDIHAGGFANKYRRLHWDEPSHTLVAHMARDCSDFIHPELNRPITVREAARLQSFPDSFRFASSQFRQLRGIGNAVPPLLARAIAYHLAKELERRK